jgi:hypothetical protein
MYTHTYGKDKAMVKKKSHKISGVNQGQGLSECRKGRRLDVRGSVLKGEGETFLEAGRVFLELPSIHK